MRQLPLIIIVIIIINIQHIFLTRLQVYLSNCGIFQIHFSQCSRADQGHVYFTDIEMKNDSLESVYFVFYRENDLSQEGDVARGMQFLASVQLGRVTDPDRAEFYAKPLLPRTREEFVRSLLACHQSYGNVARRKRPASGRESPCVCFCSMLQLQLCPPFQGVYSKIMLIPSPRITSRVDKNAEQAASFAMPTFFCIGCCRTSDLISHVGFFDEFRIASSMEKILGKNLQRFLYIAKFKIKELYILFAVSGNEIF